MNSISRNIATLRKQNQITQERLADMVGVSASAISKWESGVSNPDVALLIPIARALNTDLNTLLSFEPVLSEKHLAFITAELQQQFIKEPFDDVILVATQHLQEFPNSEDLRLRIASTAFTAIGFDSPPLESIIHNRIFTILELLNPLIHHSQPKIMHPAYYIQAQAYLMLEDFEESERCLDMIEQNTIDTMSLRLVLLQRQEKHDEVKKFGHSALFQKVNEVESLLSLLGTSIKDESVEDAIRYYQLQHEFAELFDLTLDTSTLSLFKVYCSIGNYEKAASMYHQFANHLMHVSPSLSVHPLFASIELKYNDEDQRTIRKKLIKSILIDDHDEKLNAFPEYIKARHDLEKYIQS